MMRLSISLNLAARGRRGGRREGARKGKGFAALRGGEEKEERGEIVPSVPCGNR